MRPRCGLVETKADWLNRPADEDHVLAVRQHRQQARPELHRRAAALGPPVRRLDAVREEDDAQAQRRLRRAVPLPAAGCATSAAATPATAAPGRRRRRAGSGAATSSTRDARAHGLFCPRRRRRLRPRLRRLRRRARRRRRRGRAMAELAARHEPRGQVRERRVAAGSHHLARSAADRTPAGCVRARSPSSSSTASSSPWLSWLCRYVEQPVGADDRRLVLELARQVDRLAVGVARALAAHRVEALEREAQRVDAQVARGAPARRACAAPAARAASARRRLLSSAGSVPASAGGGGVGVAEDAPQDPVAALDGAGAQRRRRRGQHRPEPQRAAAVERATRRRPARLGRWSSRCASIP